MKKKLLVLLTLSLCFIGLTKASAYAVGDTVTKNMYDADDYRIRSDRTFYIRKYNVSGSDDKIYCADASLKGYSNLKVDRVLDPDRCRSGSSNQTGCRDGAHDDYWEGLYDAALLFILNGNYYDDGKTIQNRSYTYEQRLMALRAMDNINPSFRQNKYHTGFSVNKDILKYIINSGINWAADGVESDYVNWVFGRYDRANDQWIDSDLPAGDISREEMINHLWYGTSPKVCNQNGGGCEGIGTGELDTDYEIIARAKELFQSALRYAGKYKKGEVPGQATPPKVNANFKVKSLTSELENLGKSNNLTYDEYTRELKLEVTFKGYNKSNDGPVYIKINPDTDGRVFVNGSKMYYKNLNQKNSNWTLFDGNTDFSSMLKDDDTVTFQLLIPVKATNINRLDKYKINLEINFLYREYTIGKGYRLVPNTGTITGLQYFYIGEPFSGTNEGVPHPQYFTFDWNPYDDVFCKNTNPTPDNVDLYKLYLKTCCRERENGSSRDVIVTRECDNATKAYESNKTNDNLAKMKLWCETKKAYCDYCNDKITVPYMCSEFSDDAKTVPNCVDGADASVMSPTDIKICVVDYSDIVENPYQLTKENATNEKKNGEVEGDTKSVHEYCNIYCKEDYKIGLPLGKWLEAGSSFTLDVQVDGTKSCYTDEINYNLFRKDYDKAYANLRASKSQANINTYNKVLNNYSSCATLYNNNKDQQSKLLNIKSDEQKVEFKYQEDYLKNQSGVDQKVPLKKLEEKNDDIVLWFCDGDVDNDYNKCLGGTPWSVKTENLAGFNCSGSSCSESTVTIPRTRYAKSISTNHTLFAPETEFFTNYTGNKLSLSQMNKKVIDAAAYYNSIKDPIERLNKMNAAYATIGYKKVTKTVYINQQIYSQESYPIMLSTEKGAYNFDIIFSGFGEYFSTGKTGRLIGNANSVAIKNDTRFKGEYFCEYAVNCKNCRVTTTPGKTPPITTPPAVTWEEVPYEAITTYCNGCGVVVEGTAQGALIFRQISLTNVNPSDRSLGYNLVNLKGDAAVKEIETNGEEVYNETNGKISKYEVTLTPEVINYINDYVKKNKGDKVVSNLSDIKCDTYFNTTLNKKDSAKHQVSERFDYLICHSGLLEKLQSDPSILKKAEVDNNLKNQSWVESEYCLGNDCIIGMGFGYGQVFGPAYK